MNHLRDLLSLLSEFRVQAFVRNGMQIAFREEDSVPPLPARIVKELEQDDGHSTSPRRIGGFGAPPEGFRSSTLWAGQNGKVLNFKGEYE